MKIIVSGQKLDLGSALQSYVNEKLNKYIKKLLESTISAHVVFSKQRQLYSCHIAVNEANNLHQNYINAHAEENEVYAAFDAALEKLQHILRNDSSKLKKHKAISLKDLQPMLLVDD